MALPSSSVPKMSPPTDPAEPTSILPNWAVLARNAGRLLANPGSPRVPRSILSAYRTRHQVHAAAWWSYKYSGPPTLALREDLLDALFFFCGATREAMPRPWEMRLPETAFGPMKDGVSQLRIETPLGEAFLGFLGDRPTWIHPKHGPLREPTEEEAAEERMRTARRETSEEPSGRSTDG